MIGGGFGGLSAAQHLHSDLVDLTVIDRRNYHLFQPLLYQVATGSLSAGEIASPLRSVLSRQKNTRVWLGTVVDVDPDSKRVILFQLKGTLNCFRYSNKTSDGGLLWRILLIGVGG
ncbi:MAG TPA: FAD-dependent oxidoreductase [Chthoniobacterales bacterium]|nr:FAD-dependent oxidoreductase [Chthoniobacterales bacterium]